MFRSIIAVVVFAACAAVAHAAEPAKSAKPAASQTKLELATRVAQLMHIESVGDAMLARPVAGAMQQANALVQARVAPARQPAALKDVSEDGKKFLEENIPLVQKATEKYIPTTAVPLLAERFTEDELRQIIAMLESPVKKKFEALIPEIEKSLGEKVATEIGPVMDTKLKALNDQIGVRLRTAAMP